jgi:predicted GNAT family acetyltransferase
MRVVQHPTAAQFLSATASFRGDHPTLTSIIGSVATSVATGRSYSDEFWYVVENDRGSVVGCAMRTPPWPLGVSPMSASAAAALAALLRSRDPDLPGIVGPRTVAHAIADALGRPGTVAMTEFVRVLHGYRPPTPVVGASRPATPADLDLLVAWHSQFAADAGLPIRDADNIDEQYSITIREGSTLLWEVSGEPVAMGGHASLVTTPAGTVARIGPIYTPEPLRGRGYGTAITAALVEYLLPRSELIMLFTDSQNRTSNGIYERLGFDYEDEIVEFEFESSDQSDS